MADQIRLRADALEWRTVEGEVVAVDLETSTYLAVNETGAFLWSSLAEGASMERLTSALAEEFGITPESARRDVEEFVATLREHDLIEEAGPDAQ